MSPHPQILPLPPSTVMHSWSSRQTPLCRRHLGGQRLRARFHNPCLLVAFDMHGRCIAVPFLSCNCLQTAVAAHCRCLPVCAVWSLSHLPCPLPLCVSQLPMHFLCFPCAAAWHLPAPLTVPVGGSNEHPH
eukprot:EG_transcript_45134